MDYQKMEIKSPIYQSKGFEFYFKNMKLGVLDIETTGLSPQRSSFILGGLLTVSGENAVLHQFFAETLSEESQILDGYLQEISQLDYLLTYNGKHFDIPFLQKRGGAPWETLPYNLDLYLVLKSHSSIKKFLPNLKQKTIESFMGLWSDRADEISGKESVDLYYAFLRNQDPCIKEKILLHNRDDVLQLHRLLKVLDKADLHKAMFHLGFPVPPAHTGGPSLIVDKIVLSGGTLKVSGRQIRNPISYMAYEDLRNPYTALFHESRKSFEIGVPLMEKEGLVIADLSALGIDEQPFAKYPAYGSGFLVLENNKEKNYQEINHFIKELIERILEHEL